MEEKKFNVLIWDTNHRKFTPYDVLPYFRREYDELAKSKRPKTREEWTEFVKRKGMYMYWSRCEWEIIVSEWPPYEKEDRSAKIDVWYQIEYNLDIVVDLLMSEKEKPSKSKKKTEE